MFTYEKKARALQSYEQTQSVWEMSKLIRLAFHLYVFIKTFCRVYAAI